MPLLGMSFLWRLPNCDILLGLTLILSAFRGSGSGFASTGPIKIIYRQLFPLTGFSKDEKFRQNSAEKPKNSLH
jgi:hypothetical protein